MRIEKNENQKKDLLAEVGRENTRRTKKGADLGIGREVNRKKRNDQGILFNILCPIFVDPVIESEVVLVIGRKVAVTVIANVAEAEALVIVHEVAQEIVISLFHLVKTCFIMLLHCDLHIVLGSVTCISIIPHK